MAVNAEQGSELPRRGESVPDGQKAPVELLSEHHESSWGVSAKSALRAAFGMVWAVDAFLKWQPGFAIHYVGYLQNASHGQPVWLHAWFAFWIAIVTPNALFFVMVSRILETAIALCLLLGLARKLIYVVGGLFSLLIWSTAEGFGGPYSAGATNPAPGLIYVLVFTALLIFNRIEGVSPYSIDYFLQRKWHGWRAVAEWAPDYLLDRTPPRLSSRLQAAIIASMAVTLLILFGSLQSALSAAPATPALAAAAVSPFSLVAPGPLATARDAALPPLLDTGENVDLTIVSTDKAVTIANGVTYNAWTYGDSVPGPFFHVRQGQTVHVTYTNKGLMPHSLDFHAAEVAPNVQYRDVKPNETISYSFVANIPGVFLYHCGSVPVLGHMANGMYGAIVVDPATPLPRAAASYVLVQGEWYTRQLQGSRMGPDYDKMQAMMPDEVVFNGIANQHKDFPLPVKAGQRVRLYVVDAGPSLPSAFHVVGSMFEAVYPDGNAAHALNGVSTYTIAPGQGVVFDLVIQETGKYAFVDHNMRNMIMGAMGLLEVTQ